MYFYHKTNTRHKANRNVQYQHIAISGFPFKSFKIGKIREMTVMKITKLTGMYNTGTLSAQLAGPS